MGTEKNGHAMEYACFGARSVGRNLCYIHLGQYFLCTFPIAVEQSESLFWNISFGQNLRCMITVQRSSWWFLATGTPIAFQCFRYFYSLLFFLLHFCIVYLFPGWNLMDGMKGVLRRPVVSDWRFNILSGCHLQSQVTVWSSNEWSDALVCIVIGSR